MAKKLNDWLDEFAEGGADINNVDTWPETYHGGEQVQADWNQEDNTKPDYIKNKPVITDVSNLIKSDAQGNVYINKGFKDEYTLAETFDESKTYYEGYIPIDTTKLAGTWTPDQTKTPSELTRVSKNFTEGQAMLQSNYNYVYYIDSINPNSGSIINYMNVHGYNGGEKVTNSQPMVVVNQWNMSAISFTIEDETMFNLMKNFFVKQSETVLSDELLTIDAIKAYDQQHLSYREVELTAETFVPNTYYTYENVPDWINVKDLI